MQEKISKRCNSNLGGRFDRCISMRGVTCNGIYYAKFHIFPGSYQVGRNSRSPRTSGKKTDDSSESWCRCCRGKHLPRE